MTSTRGESVVSVLADPALGDTAFSKRRPYFDSFA